MSISDFFKGRKGDAGFAEPAADTPAPTIAAAAAGIDKLSLLEELEATGLACFWATDPAGRITYLSPAIVDGLGAGANAALGQPLQAVLQPVAGDEESRSLVLRLGTRKAFSGVLVEGGPRGEGIVLRLSGRPAYDRGGEFAGFRGSGTDITAEHRSEEQASRLAKFDPLTGLANRARMEQRIDSTLQTFRSAKRAAALMMLDLDRFKQVNDTLGHPAGDELLQQVAERLRQVVAGRGEIGRLGGDEFQVLIPDMDDRGELGLMAKKIIQILCQPFSLQAGRCTIGCSVGVAIAPYDGVEQDELVRAADLALYASKNGGRGQFRFYAADLELEANLRKRMEDDLAAAIEAEKFALEYQPVVSLADNRVVALEAQPVWEDEERGHVGAESWMPVAEASRLTVRLGDWALRRACADAATWPGALRLCLNVTPVQFEATDFADKVLAVLEETGLEPSRLELEFNESVLLGEAARVDATLAQLFKAGVRLSLDQFGGGLSSLSYLRRAPFDTLKISSAFFEPVMGNDLGDMELVRAVVALAGAMGMQTAAKGVHAMALLDELRGLGIGQIQGFVFSDALPSDQVAREIAEGDWRIEPVPDGAQRATRRTVFRKIGLIHEDFYYDVMLRNLSRSGAMIQGLENVPVGTMFVLDFGSGQLAVCTVRRAMDDTQGVEFEQELVDDGAGGLCTRNRVSPYALAAAGVPLQALPAGKYSQAPAPAPGGFAQFKLSANAPRQGQPQAA